MNGSGEITNGQIMGSQLVGQSFTEPKYFWGRPSASGERPYNVAFSGGSNLGPTNAALVGGKNLEGNPMAGVLAERVEALKSAFPISDTPFRLIWPPLAEVGLTPTFSLLLPSSKQEGSPRRGGSPGRMS